MVINTSLENYSRIENQTIQAPNMEKLSNRNETENILDNASVTQIEIDQIELSEEAYQKWLETEKEEKELSIIHNVARMIIPNIKTNHLLTESLEGVSNEVINAVYETISSNLLNSNIGQISEEQRQNMIALGMEKAKYIAGNYLNGNQAETFLKAMEQIAKYGMNGQREENGRVTFDIQEGPLAHAPDDYVNTYKLMKEHDPVTFNRYTAMKQEALQTQDTSKLVAAMNIYSNWVKNSYQNNQKLYTDQIKKFTDWKKHNEETKLPSAFLETNFASKESFANSLSASNTVNNYLDTDYLNNNLERFFDLLGE